MIVSFFGHSKYRLNDGEKKQFDKVIKDILINNDRVDFYLGQYGEFDNFCFARLKELKKEFNNFQMIFVTPYLDSNYSKLQNANIYFDGSVYPPLENVPKKFAIDKRNKWMVDVSDYLIFYVKLSFGGAFNAYKYANGKKKNLINLGEN